MIGPKRGAGHKGSNGELDFKIGQNDFPEKLFRE